MNVKVPPYVGPRVAVSPCPPGVVAVGEVGLEGDVGEFGVVGEVGVVGSFGPHDESTSESAIRLLTANQMNFCLIPPPLILSVLYVKGTHLASGMRSHHEPVTESTQKSKTDVFPVSEEIEAGLLAKTRSENRSRLLYSNRRQGVKYASKLN